MTRVRYYSVPSKRRFYVIDVSGYFIGPSPSRKGGQDKDPPATYSVCDRLYNHQDIAHFYSDRGVGRVVARERAEAYAAKLNAEDEVELSQRRA